MVVLTFLKFLKSNSNTSSKLAATTTIYSQSVLQSTTFNHHLSDDTDDDYDDDDSFFELELSSPSQQPHDHDDNDIDDHDHDDNDIDDHDHDDNDDDDDEIKMHKKPQSPMSVLRGASPNLYKNVMIMMMKKKNSRVEDFADTDSVSSSFYSPKRISNDSDSNFNSDSSFTVKFKIEDGSIVPKLTRSHSSNSNSNTFTSPKLENRNVSFSEISKRFSKDTVQKYLKNIIKPKSNSKNYRNGENKNGSALPLMKEKEEKQSTSRFKVKCKQLGKCKSASAVIGVSSPSSFPVRNDFPADGIEGAILHCKRSLTSSIKGYSSLSRCSSDPSYEKSIQVAEVCR